MKIGRLTSEKLDIIFLCRWIRDCVSTCVKLFGWEVLQDSSNIQHYTDSISPASEWLCAALWAVLTPLTAAGSRC